MTSLPVARIQTISTTDPKYDVSSWHYEILGNFDDNGYFGYFEKNPNTEWGSETLLAGKDRYCFSPPSTMASA